jgi:hypothetical protein
MGDFSDDYGGYDILGLYEQRDEDRRAQRAKLLTLPRRAWVGLTLTQVKLLGEGVQEEAIRSGHSRDWVFYTHINEALKDRNK